MVDAIPVSAERRPRSPLLFLPWGDGELGADDSGLDVGGDYSRAAWLPAIGPDAWLLWGSLADGLRPRGRLELTIGALARLHGLRADAIRAALSRLAGYDLAANPRARVWCIRAACPPLDDTLLARMPRGLPGPAVAVPARPRPSVAPVGRAIARRPPQWVSRHRPRLAIRGGL